MSQSSTASTERSDTDSITSHNDKNSKRDNISNSDNKTTTTAVPHRNYDRLERLKREKRLAMNRECARARRSRKKLRMEVLENHVKELTEQNTKLQTSNEALVKKAAQLEAQLEVEVNRVRQLSAMQLQQQGTPFWGGGAAAMCPAAMGAAAMDAQNPAALLRQPSQNVAPAVDAGSDLDLQRRAAMVGLGGAMTGLRGNFIRGGEGAASSNSSACTTKNDIQNTNTHPLSSSFTETDLAHLEKLQYFQLMQATGQSMMAPAFFGGAGGPAASMFAAGMGGGRGMY